MSVRAIRSHMPRLRKRLGLRYHLTSPCLRIPAGAYETMKEHALHSVPRECCGILATEGATVAAVYRLGNVALAPEEGYRVDPEEQLWVTGMIEGHGMELAAVYHSHPLGSAVPSIEDLRHAYPDVLHVIMGMEAGLVTRAYRIECTRRREHGNDYVSHEVPVEVF